MSDAVRLAGLLVCVAASGCANILGIGDLDAGPIQDAAADSTQPREASSVADATAESCSPVAAPDAEATDAAACSAGGPGFCSPGQVSASAVVWVPPKTRQNVCTAAQVAAFYMACTQGGGDSGTSCSDFEHTASNAACAACVLSLRTDPAYGALVLSTTTTTGFINVGGCIATLDPCNAPCAHVAELASQCEDEACAACPTASTDSTCIAQAAKCPCGAYAAAYIACGKALVASASPAQACVSVNPELSFEAAALAICSAP